MHSPTPEQEGRSDNVQQAEPNPHAENDSEDQPATVVTFTICDVDLPCVVLDGTLYVQAPLQDVFDAFAAYVSDGLRHMETRISETRSAALAFDGVQRSFFGAAVVVPRVGGVGCEWR